MQTIIYIGGFELPDRNAAAQRVRNNGGILRALGYRVVLVGVSRLRPYDRKVYPADAGDSDVEAWETGYPASKSDWFDTIRADWPMRQLIGNGALEATDIAAIICYNYPAIAQAKLAQLARDCGALALADCTEWYATRRWTSVANIAKNVDVAARMYWINRRMDGIITTSPYMSRHYGANGMPIVEIPTLIEDMSGSGAAALRESSPLPLFAVASGFAEDTRAQDIHDRIDWILELLDTVVDDVPPFVLRIAGVDRERYLSVFPDHAAMIARLGERVDFLGRIPRSRLLERLEQAAFAFVLRNESRVTLAGFPSKYSEAVSFGTPVIINRIPSVEPYHVEGRTGFAINTDNREDAAIALRRILNHDRLEIAAMKRHCRGSRIFSSGSFVEPVRAFLEEAAKRTGR